MKQIIITFRSVTFAQRGERILKGAGMAVWLRRTPKWMEEQGCGYSLVAEGGTAEGICRLLKGNGIHFKRIYLQTDRGLEEVGL